MTQMNSPYGFLLQLPPSYPHPLQWTPTPSSSWSHPWGALHHLVSATDISPTRLKKLVPELMATLAMQQDVLVGASNNISLEPV